MKNAQVSTEESFAFWQGGGEMGELTRNFDWSKTSLGPPDQWPIGLRTSIAIILGSKFPMFLWWGNDLIQFYNDAYRPSLGNDGKHPKALGQKGKDCWPEIWDFIYPLISDVFKKNKSAWFENQLVPIFRNGKIEDVYWTFSYSPVLGEDQEVDGVLVVCTETTEAILNLKRLETANKQFTTLVRQAPVAIAVLRGQQLIAETINDAYLLLIGKTREEFVGKPLFESLPETRKTLEHKARELMRTGIPVSDNEVELMLNRNGKSERCYFSSLWEPLKANDGSIDGIMIVVHEITEQVLLRKKTEESEQRVMAIVESAPFPIGVYVGKERRISTANKSIMDIWGKGYDVIGKLFSEVLPELDNQEVFKQIDLVYATGEPIHIKNQKLIIEVENKSKSYYFNYSLTPLFDANGKVYGVMNTGADVTDLNIAKLKVEESEQNIRNTILKAPVAMCIFKGPQHVVQIANDRMIELWGRPSIEILNKPIFVGLPEAKDQGFEQLLDGVFNSGEAFVAQDVPITLPRRGKIEIVYVNFVYEAYKEVDGISGVIAVATDVTEQVLARKKIEEVVAERTKELATANSNLQSSNSQLAQFAYIASHDLQEPLRKVRIFSEMLEQSLGKIDEKSSLYLSKINNATSKMLMLIRDVLAYSQLSKSSEFLKQVDLQEIVDGVKYDFELLIEQKQAIIHCSGLPTIEAIPLQMTQLFGNLISNALKFSRGGVAPIITITCTILSEKQMSIISSLLQNTTYYDIEFTDNGIGFDQQYAEQIFNIFQRLHGSNEYAGTGIGLAMCKKIVENHNGFIEAAASSGGGATFRIVLPQKQGEFNC